MCKFIFAAYQLPAIHFKINVSATSIEFVEPVFERQKDIAAYNIGVFLSQVVELSDALQACVFIEYVKCFKG